MGHLFVAFHFLSGHLLPKRIDSPSSSTSRDANSINAKRSGGGRRQGQVRRDRQQPGPPGGAASTLRQRGRLSWRRVGCPAGRPPLGRGETGSVAQEQQRPKPDLLQDQKRRLEVVTTEAWSTHLTTSRPDSSRQNSQIGWMIANEIVHILERLRLGFLAKPRGVVSCFFP